MRNCKPLTQILVTLACLTNWSGGPALAQSSPNSAQPSERAKELSRERIEREKNLVAQDLNSRPVAEALAAVQETQTAVQLLDQNQPAPAKAALERAIGKLEIALAQRPNLALVPVSLDIRVVDSAIDDAALKRISSEARKLVNQGRFQPARRLLRDLASEIDAVAINLPVGTYPTAIRAAARSIDQGKTADARNLLQTALQALVVTEKIIPLPVIRAQALTDEVSRQVSEKKIDKAQAGQLLEEADRQLAYAEKLGYGSTKQDFSDVHLAINATKKMINKDKESTGLLAKIKSGLQSLKERISRPANATVS